MGSIPGQGTCLCCRAGPWVQACERWLINVSLAHHFLPPSPLSKNKFKKCKETIKITQI